MTYVGDGEASARGLNPPKLYTAAYVAAATTGANGALGLPSAPLAPSVATVTLPPAPPTPPVAAAPPAPAPAPAAPADPIATIRALAGAGLTDDAIATTVGVTIEAVAAVRNLPVPA